MDHLLLYTGKVRNVYNLGSEYLLMKATDRVSSFDRHIGTISGKGDLLNKMSEFWFNQTKHIIDNHLISTQYDVALVHKCEPFKIEVVVRAYITGNTSTSLWTHYNKGDRVYCGITFPEGLKKNQKLHSLVVTPTTKGDIDKPISGEEIINEGYMTDKEYCYVFKKALELFEFGQKLADKAGFILVDTKYEFGKDINGKILLIDELHTCDSSRYWIKSSYEERFRMGQEPEKIDKDCVRDWVKSVCDPYNDSIPEIPNDIILKAYAGYKQFHSSMLSAGKASTELSITEENVAIILSGSESDNSHVLKLTAALTKENIKSFAFVASAHKNTEKVLAIIKKYDNIDEHEHKQSRKIIWITVAGRSNALSGVVAANSKYPVIACPPFADKMDMMVNINSTLQCPSMVPVMTILEPSNVALSIKKIF